MEPMKRFFLRFLGLLVFALLIGGGIVAYDAWRFLSTPAESPGREIVITIAPGATFDRVAWDLKKAGAIGDVDRFRLLAQAQKALGRVKAGEFAVHTGWTPAQVLYQITEGRPVLYRLFVREGLTWWQTAREVERQGFARYEDFKAVIHDPEFLRAHHIPFHNAEGFLFPETYMMKKPRQPLDETQAREVADMLVRMFWKRADPLVRALPSKAAAAAPAVAEAEGLAAAAPSPATAPPSISSAIPPAVLEDGAAAPVPPSGNATAETPGAGEARVPAAEANATASAMPGRTNATAPAAAAALVRPEALRQLVVLASLVERETGVPTERGLVAGVFANRLRLGMLLQCDPTIIYGLGEEFSGPIRRSQIDDLKNVYNTYQHFGLPPGPICSPGLDSLKAAAAPPRHDFLYFVATGLGGGHTFSKTLGEHNRAVQVYRQRMKDGK